MVAIIQLAITLGAAVGGVIFDMYGYEFTFIFSAIIFALSSIVASIAALHTFEISLISLRYGFIKLKSKK